MGFVIQGFLSALTSTMDVLHLHQQHVLTRILVLLSAFALTQCSPITASKGGDKTVFFCKAQGCAANVTHVFCNDEKLQQHPPIPSCEGPPPPNTVCQYDGRAFVSIDSDANCEFEGASYIDTVKCTDQSVECAFMYATTTSPVPEKDTASHGLSIGLPIGGSTTTSRVPEKDTANYGLTVGLTIGVVMVVMVLSAFGVIWYFCKMRPASQQKNASGSDVTLPLNKTQSPEETSERDANGGGPGLSPQPDHEAQTSAAS